jgi:hypothetical protein
MPKSKKNTDIHVFYVIDRSGSMGGKEKAVVEGFNGYVAEQALLPGKCLVSVTLFDDLIEVPAVAQEAKTLHMTWSHNGGGLEYFVRGGTALRDAVGATIQGAEAWQANNPDFKGNILVVVNTDGMENASKQFTAAGLRALIEAKQEAGWTIVFQGADESWTQAKDLGVMQQHTVQYANTSAGTAGSYTSNSIGTTSLRSTGSYLQTTGSYLQIS